MERDATITVHFAHLRDRLVQIVIACVFLVILVTSLVFGFLGGLLTSLFFCVGLGLPSFFISKGQLRTPSWLAPVIFKLFQKQRSVVEAESLKCNVCGDQNCNREKIVHKQKPWAGLNVPVEVDVAVETLLEKCLEEYIQSWYTKVSMDGSFPTELRQNIRYAACVILNRLLQVDLGAFLSHKVIPVVAQHINVCLQDEKDGQNPKRVLYHPAVFSRKVELDYLRHRVSVILPVILEQKNLKCNVFRGVVTEILAGWILLPLASTADTTVLNNLLLILLGNAQLSRYPSESSNHVEFLSNFAGNHVGLETNHQALHPDLCNILKDQSLLYAFMQFLKDQGAVHVLQFCLDVEEFNKRMLIPELSSNELDLLHRDAWDLFSVYFSPHSPDNIGFPSDLVVQMRKVLSKDVTKLRTSPPLFMAYEHAYGLLDKNYCPLFHTSDEFYNWLCGPRTPASHNASGTRRSSHQRSQSAVQKLSTRLHKIKGALRPNTLDGQPFDTDVLPIDTDTEFGEEPFEEEERDLGSYRVKIHNAETKIDRETGKLTPSYTITVQKLGEGGRLDEEWCVERKLADFYALEAKLTEFHGDFPDTQLPPCGLLAPSPPTNADVYEVYLQKLIANPSLRGSDLLYRFLTMSSLEFLDDDNAFGRLLRKSVPLALRKEKGQNTDHFIASFFQSTDTKKSKSEWKEGMCDVLPRQVRCITNTVFRDNLGISLYNFPQSPPANGPTVLRARGPSDALLVLGAKLFKVPNFLVRLVLAVHSLLNKTLDSACSFYIEKRLRALLVPQRIAHLIGLLQWVVFERQSKSDSQEVAAKVEERISQLSGLTYTFYQTIYKLVQNRILNKHLLYSLLDIVLDELFPEIANKNE